MDDGAAVTDTTSGHVDNVRVANYASLPAANIGTSTPTGEIEIFVSATDGGLICDRYDIGPPRTSVPTIRKDDRWMCGAHLAHFKSQMRPDKIRSHFRGFI